MKEYRFKVETIESGQRHSYGDSFYHYKVTTTVDEYKTKKFCMSVLGTSYEKKDMPNHFAGKLLEFRKETDNNKGRGFLEERKEETYIYRYTSLFTG